MEGWKDIKGFAGIYQCNKYGIIRSNLCHWKNKTGILTPYVQSKGYRFVSLYKEGRGYPYLVHRLIAETFIPNPLNLPQVNHKDFNKANNAVSNLEWVTNSENREHAKAGGRWPHYRTKAA